MFTWIARSLRFNSTVLGLLLSVLVVLLCWVDALHSFELWVSDFHFKVRGALLPGPEVVIASIDAKSIEEVFPRRPTTPSRMYKERCEFLQDSPPWPDWDGSWTLTSK